MKIRSLLSGAVMLVMGATMNLPSNAQGTRRAPGEFFCSSSNGVPATLVQHPQRGEVVFIRWTSDYFDNSGWTPQRRCEEVSARFQSAQQRQILTYIVPDQMNGYGVVCASKDKDGSCEQMLFTLKRGANAQRVIQQIEDVNRDANADALDQSGRGLERNSRGEQVLHVPTFLTVTRDNVRRNAPPTQPRNSGGGSLPSCSQTLWGTCAE